MGNNLTFKITFEFITQVLNQFDTWTISFALMELIKFKEFWKTIDVWSDDCSMHQRN